MMYRITERLAKRKGALAIVNGESVGQVASQTLTSMNVINNVTNFPVIRPVACLDKLEIIDIAKKLIHMILVFCHMKIAVQFLFLNILL